MANEITNQAAWQHEVGQPLQLSTAGLVKPAANEILIRNAAIGINPIDWLLQDNAMLPWLDYPTILGSDVAGEVAAVGSAVERFKVGDRVVGQAVGTTVNQATQGAFQQHTIVLEHMAAPIPDDLAFTEAAVLPLGLGTAASGLYGETQLALLPPSLLPDTNTEVVLVWGGSSSVGCNAIQLATASGYTVFTTASSRHEEMLKTLGAAKVFDYSSDTLVENLLAALEGHRLAGTLHATGSLADCAEIVARAQGSTSIAATLPAPENFRGDVKITHIFGTALKDDDIGAMIYEHFLPAALANGSYLASPKPMIAGHGLDSLQGALDLQKAGVSGTKVIVTLG